MKRDTEIRLEGDKVIEQIPSLKENIQLLITTLDTSLVKLSITKSVSLVPKVSISLVVEVLLLQVLTVL